MIFPHTTNTCTTVTATCSGKKYESNIECFCLFFYNSSCLTIKRCRPGEVLWSSVQNCQCVCVGTSVFYTNHQTHTLSLFVHGVPTSSMNVELHLHFETTSSGPVEQLRGTRTNTCVPIRVRIVIYFVRVIVQNKDTNLNLKVSLRLTESYKYV